MIENISLADLKILRIICYRRWNNDWIKYHNKNSKEYKKYKNKERELFVELNLRIDNLLKL